MTLIIYRYLSNLACLNRVVSWANTVCVHWTGDDALVSALINNVPTPPIVTSWIDIISLTFLFNHDHVISILNFPVNDLCHDSIGNCLVSYFLDLMSRSWLAFVECDWLIRITGSYLSRSRADRFWNRALETVAADSTILLKAARCPHQLLLTVNIICDPLPNVLSAHHFHNGQVLIPDKCTRFFMGLFLCQPIRVYRETTPTGILPWFRPSL